MTQCPVRAVPRLPRRVVRNQIRAVIDGQQIAAAVQAHQSQAVPPRDTGGR